MNSDNEHQESKTLASEGAELFEQGQYKEALTRLERALDRDPDNAYALSMTGAVLSEQGRYWQSLRMLEQALALNPDYAFALGVKGAVLAELDRYDEALTSLAKARAEDVNYGFVLAMRAQILCNTAYYELALLELDDATQRGLENDWTLYLKGWALQNLEDSHVQRAPSVYETALQRNLTILREVSLRTAYGRALSLIGTGYSAGTQYRRAIEQARTLSGRPDAMTYASVGWCHYGLGQYGEAVKYLVTASSLNTGLIFTQFDIALALMSGDRRSHALSEYRSALRSVEEKHILRRRGLLDVALRDLSAAVAERPDLTKEDTVRKGLEQLQEEWEKVKTATPQVETMSALRKEVSQRAWDKTWYDIRKSTTQ